MADERLGVVVDRHIFMTQRRGGVSRYFVELARQFQQHPELGIEMSIPIRRSVNEPLRELDPGRYRALGEFRDGSLASRVVDWTASTTAEVAPRGWREADIVHHTYYSPEIIDRTPGAHRVVTVHDMIHELFPELPGAEAQSARKRLALQAADAIICVSDSTRTDLERLWGAWVEAPIHVIHHGVGAEFTPVGSAHRPGYEYLLYVGARAGYKAFSDVLEAIALAGPDLGDAHLVCVGGGSFTQGEGKLIRALGLEGRVHQAAVAQQDLPSYYRGARAFVFPTHYEGFGMPLLEAMACGCPAIVSDTPALVEVGVDCVRRYRSGDVEALAVQLASMHAAEIPDLRSSVASARDRAARFTWLQAAGRTADVYRSVESGAG